MTVCNLMKEAITKRVEKGGDIGDIGNELCPDVKFPRAKIIRILKETLGHQYLKENAKQIGYQGSSQLGRKPGFMFCWDDIKEGDGKELVENCLWGRNLEKFSFKFEKHRIIVSRNGEEKYRFELNKLKTLVAYRMNDKLMDTFIAKEQNGKLNIYLNVKKISLLESEPTEKDITDIKQWLEQLEVLQNQINPLWLTEFGFSDFSNRINAIKLQLTTIKNEANVILNQLEPEIIDAGKQSIPIKFEYIVGSSEKVPDDDTAWAMRY